MEEKAPISMQVSVASALIAVMKKRICHNKAKLHSHLILKEMGTEWTYTQSTTTGQTSVHYVFAAAIDVLKAIARSVLAPYDAWKHFINKSLTNDCKIHN